MTPSPREWSGPLSQRACAAVSRPRIFVAKVCRVDLAAGVIIVAAIVLMKLGQLEPVATNLVSP
jgi:hypothetical protein